MSEHVGAKLNRQPVTPFDHTHPIEVQVRSFRTSLTRGEANRLMRALTVCLNTLECQDPSPTEIARERGEDPIDHRPEE